MPTVELYSSWNLFASSFTAARLYPLEDPPDDLLLFRNLLLAANDLRHTTVDCSVARFMMPL